MQPSTLEYAERAFLPLAHHGWIDVKRFDFAPSHSDPLHVLGLLIRHDRFRDNYATATSHDDGGDLHGPYPLSALVADAYEPVGLGEVVVTLSAFASLHCSKHEAATQRKLLNTNVLPLLRDATSCYRLRDLGERAFHEWGWVLEHFTEVVAIDQVRGILTVVVAAED